MINEQGWGRYEGKTDDEIYYINMSPMTDGVNMGMYQSEDLVNLDYWYPRQEHKQLYLEGAQVSGMIQMYLLASVSIADYYNKP